MASLQAPASLEGLFRQTLSQGFRSLYGFQRRDSDSKTGNDVKKVCRNQESYQELNFPRTKVSFKACTLFRTGRGSRLGSGGSAPCPSHGRSTNHGVSMHIGTHFGCLGLLVITLSLNLLLGLVSWPI